MRDILNISNQSASGRNTELTVIKSGDNRKTRNFNSSVNQTPSISLDGTERGVNNNLKSYLNQNRSSKKNAFQSKSKINKKSPRKALEQTPSFDINHPN